ncbi:nuclear RNA export factor 3 [Ursus maritimus]|uniref:Nuclear RNA export factor 3 n=1 Tax=Ursus maritimus TaxID=29073 RepID=A0A8M1FRH8_URSMA|nr:nuclear RNA export factor 3 [Ursus maritimus]
MAFDTDVLFPPKREVQMDGEEVAQHPHFHGWDPEALAPLVAGDRSLENVSGCPESCLGGFSPQPLPPAFLLNDVQAAVQAFVTRWHRRTSTVNFSAKRSVLEKRFTIELPNEERVQIKGGKNHRPLTLTPDPITPYRTTHGNFICTISFFKEKGWGALFAALVPLQNLQELKEKTCFFDVNLQRRKHQSGAATASLKYTPSLLSVEQLYSPISKLTCVLHIPLKSRRGKSVANLQQLSLVVSKPPAPDPTDSLHKQPGRTLVTGHCLQSTPWVSWSARGLGLRSPEGHNDVGNSLQRRTRCWGIYRRRYNNWSEQVSSGGHSSSHQQQDGDPATNGAHTSTRVRYAPYAIPPRHRRGNFQKQDQTQANVEGKQKPPERRVEQERQDETMGKWYKIIIPFGIKYDEKWLLDLIQGQCSVPFTPIEFHYERMQAQFFVEDASVAFALKGVNGKIWDEANERISIFIYPSGTPHSVQKELKSEKVEQTKLPMNKRYVVSQQALNIQRVHFGPDLITHDIEMVPSLRNSMAATLQTHEKNMPEVKSAGELDQGKSLQPEEMSAGGSPPCTAFPDKSTNISSILELFPKLLRLDSQESPSPTSVGIAAHKRLPTCKGSFFGSDALKSLVLRFLQQYYLIYDSGDRQGLLGAYHNEACFSLAIPFNPGEPAASSLCEYFKENRNMKKLKDPSLRVQLLKRTKCDIMRSLCVLPKTQHDLSSFVVDMWFQTEMMLCFSVNGVFKEAVGMSQDSVRAFTRTFITTPVSKYSLCIVNDDLFVRDASPKETPSTVSIPVPTPSCSSWPTLCQKRQEMGQTFSTQSGMNLQWFQK